MSAIFLRLRILLMLLISPAPPVPLKRTVVGAELAECAALNERRVLPMVGLCKSFGDDGI